MKINYVVAFYITDNRNNFDRLNLYHSIDKFFAVKCHIDALNTYTNPYITQVTFIINKSEHVEYGDIEKIVETMKCKIPIEVKYRDNWGLSYHAWEYHIRQSIDSDYDYYFLTEDDYVICNDNFYQPFLDKITESTGFVCGIYWDEHPAVSYKLISRNVCKKIYDSNEEIFYAYNHKNISQVDYHKHFLENNLCIKDVTDSMPVLFKRLNNLIFINKTHYKNMPIGYFYESFNINQNILNNWINENKEIKIIPLL